MAKIKENIIIEIDRESVHPADDMENHIIKINVPQNITFTNLFKKLVEENYFPKIIGNNVVWVLTYDEGDYVVWITNDNEYITHFIEDVDIKINSLKNLIEIKIKFCYYTSPFERAKYIYKIFEGEKFHIWHENYMKEYEHYKISEEIENKWLEEIRNKK
jgi:hypothetical protein